MGVDGRTGVFRLRILPTKILDRKSLAWMPKLNLIEIALLLECRGRQEWFGGNAMSAFILQPVLPAKNVWNYRRSIGQMWLRLLIHVWLIRV